MAVKVTNNGILSFGLFSAAATLTHVRFRKGSDDSNPVVSPLTANLAVAANQQVVITSGSLEALYPSGRAGVLEVSGSDTTFRTELAADVDASQTTIPVLSAADLAVNDRIRVDTEDMTISSISGTTLTVTRGAHGTTAAAHDGDGMTSNHMEAVVKEYWENTAMEVDLMTSASAVASVGGYAQVSHSAWTFTQEAD